MINLVTFLLIAEKLINYSKKDIDGGNTPPLIYKICSCIRETFCLSYAIRKKNELLIYFRDENLLIKFSGSSLRYLGSDERSQVLLLQKALIRSKEINPKEYIFWKKSTPGIYITKLLNDELFLPSLASMDFNKNYFIFNDKINKLSDSIEMENIFSDKDVNNTLFIIPIYQLSEKDLNFIHLFNQLKNIKFINLPKIEAIEDIILYINFLIDKLEMS